MDFRFRPWTNKKGNVLSNPHFWGIVLIIAGLTVMYYEDIILTPDQQWEWFWPIKYFEYRYNLHGILYYLPFIYAATIFWWRGAALTWLVCMALAFPLISYYLASPSFILANIFYLLIPLLIVTIISLELKWRDRERKALAEREAERQSYMSQIFKAQEDERHRLARELHDDATQTLLVIATRAQNLGACEKVGDAGQYREQAEWIKNTAISVSEELRRLSMDLRPGILDNLGLVPALRWLVTGLSQDGVKARLEVRGEARTLSSDIDINLFRIVQEALNNIRRHSKATEALVEVEFVPDWIKLTVQDNGIGFNMPRTNAELTATGKLGLTGIQQRVQFLGGSLTFDSEIGRGTKVFIELRA